MSKEALAKVVQRAISDAGFRRQLNSDPAGALRGFDLSADEVSALRTGDAGRLSTLGIDQRMSKSFALGGAVAATRLTQSDLSASDAAMIDDGSVGSRTVIPHDSVAAGSADATGSEAVRSKINDDPGGFLAAADASGGVSGTTVRVGDDWKFANRGDAQAHAAPLEGSPEADAAQNASGGGMAAYPAHDGLAGPSALGSARAGDDWARSAQAAGDAGRIGSARLDDASGSSSGASAIHDDPDGFLAAADAREAGSVTRANVIHDDPNGFLAANANADTSASAGDGTAFIDESEAYLTKVGYDANASTSAVTDAHDRQWSGDDNAGPNKVEDDDVGNSSAGEGGPNIQP